MHKFLCDGCWGDIEILKAMEIIHIHKMSIANITFKKHKGQERQRNEKGKSI